MEIIKCFIITIITMLLSASCSDDAIKPQPVINHSNIQKIEYSISSFAPQYYEIYFTKDTIHYFVSKWNFDSLNHPEININKSMNQNLWDSLTNSFSLSDFMLLDTNYVFDSTSSDPTSIYLTIWFINNSVKTIHFLGEPEIDEISDLIKIISDEIKKF